MNYIHEKLEQNLLKTQSFINKKVILKKPNFNISAIRAKKYVLCRGAKYFIS